ncbi:MAG: hypothetical protein KDA42_13825 [Planctomycetales bacterium]|nr:hypothetical protein [Planctomycetales bacterium]
MIDLLRGEVVHGIAGDRAKYRPLQSVLTPNATPSSVASALVSHFASEQVYVADLDAIMTGHPSWKAIGEIAQSGAGILLDAGVRGATQAVELAQHMAQLSVTVRMIIGLESLQTLRDLEAIVRSQGETNVVLSLDMRGGVPVTVIEAWQSMQPMQIVRAAYAVGVRRFLLLDLHGVGSNAGVPTLPLCRLLRDEMPRVEIISGGGVRSCEDLVALQAAGCDGALVATSLHNGAICPAEVQRLSAQTPLR